MPLASTSGTSLILDLLELRLRFRKGGWAVWRDVALSSTGSAILNLDLVSVLERVLHLLVRASPNSSLTLHRTALRVVGDLHVGILQSPRHRIGQRVGMNMVLKVLGDV